MASIAGRITELKRSSRQVYAKKKPEFRIRWVLTHEPIALFEEAAKSFARMVHDESGGRMEVQVFTPKEYGKGRWVPPAEVMGRVATGDLEMSQTYATVLGKLYHQMWALDIPFLFSSHAHAAKALDGFVGQQLLQGLVPYGLRGLAFTYSGGYRIISSVQRQIKAVEDFRGLRVRTSDNPVAAALFRDLGAVPHAAPLQEIPALTRAGTIDAAETTWPRYWDMGHHQVQPIVNETGHSLFLTTLVVNEGFFQSLPLDCQQTLADTARQVAVAERIKSIADGELARQAWLARGGTIICWPVGSRDRLATATAVVANHFAREFGNGLIESIQSMA